MVLLQRVIAQRAGGVPAHRLLRAGRQGVHRQAWKGVITVVGNFRQKNYSAEDGTTGLFRRNFNCSAEQKTLGIPFRIIPQRRKKLGILYHGTNSVPNHSSEEKPTRNSVRGTNKEANARNSVPMHFSEENTLSILFAGAGFIVRPIFFMSFRSVLSFGIDSSVNLGMPRNLEPRNHSVSIPPNFSNRNSLASGSSSASHKS